MSDISDEISGMPAASPHPTQSTGQNDTPEIAAKLSDLKEKAAEDIRQVRQAAEQQADAALDATAEKATGQKNFLAGQLSSVARALDKVGAELASDDQPTIGRYAQDLGSSAKRIADDVRNKDLGEVASIVEHFGRKQPVAFLGFAALAGFAASRFVTASAQRRPAQPSGGFGVAGNIGKRDLPTNKESTDNG